MKQRQLALRFEVLALELMNCSISPAHVAREYIFQRKHLRCTFKLKLFFRNTPQNSWHNDKIIFRRDREIHQISSRHQYRHTYSFIFYFHFLRDSESRLCDDICVCSSVLVPQKNREFFIFIVLLRIC